MFDYNQLQLNKWTALGDVMCGNEHDQVRFEENLVNK